MPTQLVPTTVDTEVPTWKSPNELIHERINFDDTIWGFGLAGGAYYKTPLRITYVRPDSRAEKAHIYPGDIVLKINGIDSSTLTLDQAHQMILESGIHLKINVTSPEDLEDKYFAYEDQLVEDVVEEEKVAAEKKKVSPRISKFSGKCSHWSLQWPWKGKRKIIYKESNCYLVPSKYEDNHKDTRKPEVKQDDTIILDSIYNVKGKKNAPEEIEKNNTNDLIESKENDENILGNKPVKNQADSIIKQQESVDKNDEGDAKDQKGTVSRSNEDTVREEKNMNETIETIGSLNKNDEEAAIEQNSSVDKISEDIDIEENAPDNKINDNCIVHHNSSLDDNDEVNLMINNLSTDGNEIVADVHNNLINKDGEDGVKEETISKDVDDKSENVEPNDAVVENKSNDENVKFENSDIPVISESENFGHNSR